MANRKKKVLVFASGGKTGGGSGFVELVENSRSGILDGQIAGVISNHNLGGVRRHADLLGVPFEHMPKPWNAEAYLALTEQFQPDLICLSGWLKLVRGLDMAHPIFSPTKVINIHPGPLPRFGGPGHHGHHVHEKVMEAFALGEITYSAVTMHFVTSLPEGDPDPKKAYDAGPVFFEYPLLIRADDTPDTLAARVNKIEHGWQSYVTNLVLQGQISWDGINPMSLQFPTGFPFLPKLNYK